MEGNSGGGEVGVGRGWERGSRHEGGGSHEEGGVVVGGGGGGGGGVWSVGCV